MKSDTIYRTEGEVCADGLCLKSSQSTRDKPSVTVVAHRHLRCPHGENSKTTYLKFDLSIYIQYCTNV